jgi:meso-butanediol dehydrogenase/(S,S)-butanediol dehydrogenase/diacetyl reductase
MHVLRESSKLMSDNTGCSIVIVSSGAGLIGLPGFSAYSASKHGVIGLARCLAKELGPRGIRVNCVAPGAIDTPMQQEVNGGPGPGVVEAFAKTLPMGRQGEAVEVARLIAFLLGEESSYVTGSVYTIDGGHMC